MAFLQWPQKPHPVIPYVVSSTPVITAVICWYQYARNTISAHNCAFDFIGGAFKIHTKPPPLVSRCLVFLHTSYWPNISKVASQWFCLKRPRYYAYTKLTNVFDKNSRLNTRHILTRSPVRNSFPYSSNGVSAIILDWSCCTCGPGALRNHYKPYRLDNNYADRWMAEYGSLSREIADPRHF